MATVARTTARRVAPPLEHRILVTATLILIAFGAVMVYSASSPQAAIDGTGLGTGEFIMYLVAAGIGLGLMRFCERHGLSLLTERTLRLLLVGSFVLLLAVLVPGVGIEVLGARRWIGAGALQFQPSEIMKLALVLYVARYLADHPRRMTRPFKEAVAPIAVVVGPAALLIAVEPDLGTALVVLSTTVALLIVGGMPLRYIGMILGIIAAGAVLLIIVEPYERARLTSFLHPFAVESGNGYQAVQGQIAVGSGGFFGVGLGNSVQKALWLPEAQTDFILAVIGEELGFLGIGMVLCLYGLIGYAGLRTARRAGTRYAKLLAAGITSLILCQGILNVFVVLGIAPLTGVPLPFISYAPTNLVVMLTCIGLLLGIARPAAKELRLVDQRGDKISITDNRDRTENPDRDRRDSRSRRSGTGRSGRAAG